MGAEQSSLSVETSSLSGGMEYVISVRATSGNGLHTVVKARLLVDRTPPQLEAVYIGEAPHTNTLCQNIEQPISISWHGATDSVSGIARYDWAVGSTPLSADLKPFAPIDDGHSGRVVRSWVPPTVRPFEVGAAPPDTKGHSESRGEPPVPVQV